ncbi:hypothetical protein [Aliikangiella coralliicola]|uniref:Uncharacterized protein n=1 Tax=Aliikangiella coralliicola TaxID=2592383 RepID=A0A545U660_9GAMM|nr:hypothetical protein [Aliikangiella coralliicola]TQV84946.1 hypothetical protein FLL46_21370 [Aliikangiella coralliicola]
MNSLSFLFIRAIPFIIFLLLVCISTSPLADGESSNAIESDYDKTVYNKAKTFVEKLSRRFDKLENRWTRLFEDRVFYLGVATTREDLINKATGRTTDFQRYDSVLEKYRNWQAYQDTSARDYFRRNIAALINNSVNQTWRMQQDEAWYRIKTIEFEFFDTPEFKTFDKELAKIGKRYGYVGKEYQAAVSAFKNKIAVVENKKRNKALKDYKNLTGEMLERRRELVAASWAWVALFKKLGDTNSALAIKKNLYTELAVDLRYRHKPVHKELGIDFFTWDSTLDVWHRKTQPQDRLRLNIYALPKETQYFFSMQDDFFNERVDSVKAIALDDKPVTYRIAKIELDDIPWFTSFAQLKQDITNTKIELKDTKQRVEQNALVVKKLKEKLVASKQQQERFTARLKQAKAFIERQKSNYPKELELHLNSSEYLQQHIDSINQLMKQLDGEKNSAELLALAKEEEALLQQKKVSDDILKKYRDSNQKIQKQMFEASKLLGEKNSQLIAYQHQVRIAKRDLSYANARLESSNQEVEQLQQILAPLEKAKKKFEKIGKDIESKGTLVNHITVYADNKMKLSTHRWAPGDVLPELEAEIRQARRRLADAKQGLTRASAQFTNALEYAQAELSQLTRVILGAAYSQAVIEIADFAYDVLKANKNGGPPAALVEALYKLAEQKVTGNQPIETLSDQAVKDIETEVRLDLARQVSASIRAKTKDIPGYIKTRTFEETIGNYGKSVALKTKLAGWAQTMVRDNRAYSLQQFYKNTPDLSKHLKTMRAKQKALDLAQTQLENLQKPFSFDVKEIAGNYAKDFAKDWAKSILKNAEHAAWYKYYLADIKARALHPTWQEWQRLYFDTQDELAGLLKAREILLKGYDKNTGFKANLNRSFEKGQVLRILLEVDGYDTEYEVFLNNEKASSDDYRRFRVESNYINAKNPELTLTIKEESKR